VLREKQLPYDVRKVDMGSRGADFEELYRSVLPDADTTTKVPVLVDGDHGVSLVESTVIMEYLNQQVGG
jgi:glutathione S-transferase